MDVQFVASFSPIVRDAGAASEFYGGALGLSFEGGEGDYVFTEKLPGVKHFGLWPLSEAAEACFGSSEWPAEVPVPQASIEFGVRDVAAAAAELEGWGYRLPSRRQGDQKSTGRRPGYARWTRPTTGSRRPIPPNSDPSTSSGRIRVICARTAAGSAAPKTSPTTACPSGEHTLRPSSSSPRPEKRAPHPASRTRRARIPPGSGCWTRVRKGREGRCGSSSCRVRRLDPNYWTIGPITRPEKRRIPGITKRHATNRMTRRLVPTTQLSSFMIEFCNGL